MAPRSEPQVALDKLIREARLLAASPKRRSHTRPSYIPLG